MKTQLRIWVIAGGAAVLAGVVGLLAKQGWAAAVTGAGVLMPVAAYLADRIYASRADLDLKAVADRIADLVKTQWAAEANRREIEPLLDVSWRPADPALTSPWPELVRLAGRGIGGARIGPPVTDPSGLAGAGNRLLDTFDRTPCRRLIVLGDAGAGKTVLLLRLVLDLLDRRQDGQPVPLLIPLASWNPDLQSRDDWLEQQILREYPTLAAPVFATGTSRARALLNAGLILPVLDGLDEIRIGGRTEALRALNAAMRDDTQLVLSCRPDDFHHAVRPGPDIRPLHLTGATSIHLAPVGPNTVTDYLINTAGDDGHTRWAAIRTALATPTSPIAAALTTPLMASLARTIYNPRQGESTLGLPHPTNLITLPTAAAVEQHLLAGFIPAAYRPHPDRPVRWNAEQAARYLAFLSHLLEHQLHTTSLAWWEIPRAVPHIYLSLTQRLAHGLMMGLFVGILYDQLLPGLALGLISISYTPRQIHFTPHRINRNMATSELMYILGLGIALALLVGVAIMPIIGLKEGLLVGSAVGLWLGLGFLLGIGTPIGDHGAVHPRSVFVQDRTHTLAFGTVTGFALGLAFGAVQGTKVGLEVGLAFTLTSLIATSAHGQIGSVRPWLAARRQQPLHLIAFLEDAHARGVLRQAGAVWEFRHANLQRYLAGPP